jgi:hypothetical protein
MESSRRYIKYWPILSIVVWYGYCTAIPFFYAENETANHIMYEYSYILGILILSLIVTYQTKGPLHLIAFFVSCDWLYEAISHPFTNNEFDLLGNTIQNALVLIATLIYGRLKDTEI